MQACFTEASGEISGSQALVPLKAKVHSVVFILNSFKPVKISPRPHGFIFTSFAVDSGERVASAEAARA
jgi:hypothetical protein